MCELCGRWLCEKHIKPRTFLLRGLDGFQDGEIPEGIGLDDIQAERTPEQVTLLLGSLVNWIKIPFRIMDKFGRHKTKQEKWKGGDIHPDFQYTRKLLEELDVEEKKRNELTKRALDRMNRYYSQEKSQSDNLKYAEARDKTESKEKLETEHFPIRFIASSMVLLILAIVLWYLPTIISYLQRL